jgi:hypothetical protein
MTILEIVFLIFILWAGISIYIIAYRGDKGEKERRKIREELKQIKNGLNILFYDWDQDFSIRNDENRLTQKEKDLIEYLGIELYEFEDEDE